MGVNTFLSTKGSPTTIPGEVIRATIDEKERQIKTIERNKIGFAEESAVWIEALKSTATNNKNVFEVLMEATKYCTIGQITDALFGVGGQYRRNM